jgi:hypothetical protein
MSSSSQTLESSSHFKSILDAALSEYKSKTGNDLTNNSLAKELQGCESAEAVLDIIQREAKAFDKFRDGDKRLMKWIGPSVERPLHDFRDSGPGRWHGTYNDPRYKCIYNVVCRCFLLRMWSLLGSESCSSFVHPCFSLSSP